MMQNSVHVCEVDDLGHVCQGEPGRVRVSIDRDDAKAPLARLRDRAALVASRADEEDARHGAMLDEACRAAVEGSARR